MDRPSSVCSQCGSANEIGRMFCMSCGGKLDLDRVIPAGGKKVPGFGKKGRRVGCLLHPLVACAPAYPGGDASEAPKRAILTNIHVESSC